MNLSRTNHKNPSFKLREMMALTIVPAALIGCATVNPGAYEVTAYDPNGKIVRAINIVVTDDRSLFVPMNAMCIAYLKSRVVARPKNGAQSVERQC